MSRSVIKKTLLLSSTTLVSRLFGFARELLLPRYLGVGIIADAYVTAFRIPNSLRKIFAEGALSAASVPTLVRMVKEQGRSAAGSVVIALFFLVEGIILLLCTLIAFYAQGVLSFVAPGWSYEQIAVAVPLLKIFIFFIFFISSSALLAAALQAVNHYMVPIIAQIVLNVIQIAAILLCMRYDLPVATFAWSLVVGGGVMLLLHALAYYRYDFMHQLKRVRYTADVHEILRKFGPSLLSVGIIEINLFVSSQFASYLPAGSISLYSYASNFMRLPLGVLIIPFSTILFTHFSRVSTYAPRRLHYYLLEASKVILWVMTPLMFLMAFFAQDIFRTLYLSEKFTMQQVVTAQWLLIIMLSSMLFFSINKILLNLFYALHETFIPSMITLCGAVVNTVLDVILMRWFGIYGLAWAMSLAAALQTVLFLFFLRRTFHFTLMSSFLRRFLTGFFMQFLAGMFLFASAYYGIYFLCSNLPVPWAIFFTQRIGLWLWVGPLCLLLALWLLVTRKLFSLRMHFVDL